MTKEDIVSVPDQILRRPSQKVTVIDDEVHKLVKNMISSTVDWEKSRGGQEIGVAMAAVQVGQPYKVIIVRQANEESNQPDYVVLINPEIVKTEGELSAEAEGCLSVPDIYGKVRRYPKVKIEAQNLEGDHIRITAEDFLARLLQHEIDHLKGKLFIDKVADEELFKIQKDGKLKPLTPDEVKQYRLLWYRHS